MNQALEHATILRKPSLLSVTPPLYVGATALWRLDEVSGLRADSISSLDLSDTNIVTQGAGQIGNAAVFSESGGPKYLSIGGGNALDGGSKDFAFALMWYPTTLTNDTGILSRWLWGSNKREFLIYYNGGNIQFWVDLTGNGAGQSIATSSVTPTINNWYKVVVWHENGVGIGITVNNETPVTTPHTGGVADFGAAQPFVLGNYGVLSSSSNVDGRLDHVIHWGRIPTAQDITDYNNNVDL